MPVSSQTTSVNKSAALTPRAGGVGRREPIRRSRVPGDFHNGREGAPRGDALGPTTSSTRAVHERCPRGTTRSSVRRIAYASCRCRHPDCALRSSAPVRWDRCTRAWSPNRQMRSWCASPIPTVIQARCSLNGGSPSGLPSSTRSAASTASSSRRQRLRTWPGRRVRSKPTRRSSSRNRSPTNCLSLKRSLREQASGQCP